MNKTLNNYYDKIIFFFIFIIGVFIFNDYGIAIDEDNSRINGYVTLKYIFDILNINFDFSNLDFTSLQDIRNYDEQGNGVVFDLPLAFIEYIFGITDIRTYYLLRHFLTFLLFFTSLVFLYKIVLLTHNSKKLALISVIILFFSPRIFAESFYNSKDIGLLSLNLISLYFGIIFLKKKDYKNLFIFIILSSLAIGIRILGLVQALIIIFILIFKHSEQNKKKFYNFYLIFLFFFPICLIFFWPYLWEDPVNNLANAFNILSNHYRPIYNFFLGEYISALYVPWYYSLTWILITTPLFIISLFILGFLFVLKRLYKRLINIKKKILNKNLWSGNIELYNLIYFFNIIIPIFAVIILHSSLYTGWRHLYFIYPNIILLAIYGIYLLNIIFKNKIKLIYSILLLFIFSNTYWIIKNHPYQYVYFNSLAGKKLNQYFEVDYWGVSNYNSLKFILNKTDKFTVGMIGDGDLLLSIDFLNKKDKAKITYSNDFKKVDFLIDNFNRWNAVKKTKYDEIILKNFDVYKVFKTDNVTFSIIYKNNFIDKKN